MSEPTPERSHIGVQKKTVLSPSRLQETYRSTSEHTQVHGIFIVAIVYYSDNNSSCIENGGFLWNLTD